MDMQATEKNCVFYHSSLSSYKNFYVAYKYQIIELVLHIGTTIIISTLRFRLIKIFKTKKQRRHGV